VLLLTIHQEIEDRVEFMDSFASGRLILPRPACRHEFPVFAVARRWNSWYPSYFGVEGGCYVLITRNSMPDTIVIDPGFGFMNTLRKRFGIEPQDINKVIVSHFHPDHMAGLIEFLTLMFEAGFSCDVYLNETCYEFFRGFHGKGVKIHELSPGQTVQLSKYEVPGRYNSRGSVLDEILLKPVQVHHSEIRLRHKALGLLLDVHTDVGAKESPSYRIGIIGDTDGRQEYIPQYVEQFRDTDVLVIHLGTFSDARFGSGDKHLYIQGTKNLLHEIIARKQTHFPKLGLIIMSEFGLELAGSREILQELGPFYRSREAEMSFFLVNSLRHGRFEQYIFGNLTYEHFRNLVDPEKQPTKTQWAVEEAAMGTLAMVLNRKEHRDHSHDPEKWIGNYVPNTAMGVEIDEYIQSDELELAVRNNDLYEGVRQFVSCIVDSVGESPTKILDVVKSYSQMVFSSSQEFFFSPNEYARHEACAFGRFNEAIRLLEEDDTKRLPDLPLKATALLSMLTSGLLYYVAKQMENRPALPLVEMKQNALPYICGYFDQEIGLGDSGISIVPGDIGIMAGLDGGDILIKNTEGSWVAVKSIQTALDNNDRIVFRNGRAAPQQTS
jgi:hypothetical protein